MGKLTTLALLLAGCGGLIEHDPPAITAVCVVECVRFGDGHRECVTLTSPSQLDEPWWEQVVAVEYSGPCMPEAVK